MKINIKNIGIFAHIDSGKTTFTERILYEAGELSTPGNVEEGTTEMDTLPEEIQRGISITASTSQIKFKYKKSITFINIIDTPGHLDFHSQVDSTLLAVDIAVLLIDITTGIRSQTEMIIKKLNTSNIPIIIFINKIDKNTIVDDLILEINQLFIGKKTPVFKIHSNSKIEYLFENKEIDENIELSYIEWNTNYIDKYFSAENKKKVLMGGLKEGFVKKELFPIFAGSGLLGIGIKEFLKFISSLEIQFQKRSYDAIIFKKQIHPILGRITYLKTFNELKEGDIVFHREIPFEITKLYIIIPGGFHEVREVSENSIVAFSSPIGGETDHFKIGDFLFKNPPEEGEERSEGFQLNYGKDFIQKLEPEKPEDKEDLLKSIIDVVWEDPGLDVSINGETGQIQLHGMGELHLEVSIKRIESFFHKNYTKKDIYVSKYYLFKSDPIKCLWEHHTSDEKFFSYTLNVLIKESNSFTNYFNTNISLSKNKFHSLESAFTETLSHLKDGIPLLGINLIIENIIPPKKESEHSIPLTKVAIIAGLKNLPQNHWIKIGPESHFEIFVPHSQVGTIISALQKRNAIIKGMEVIENNKTCIIGSAAAEYLLGFGSVVRNLTQGKATLSQSTGFTDKVYFKLI